MKIEQITFKNQEILVKEKVEKTKADMFDVPRTDSDRLVEVEVFKIGVQCKKTAVKDKVLVRKDLLRELKHDVFRGYSVILNEDNILAWITED